MNNPSALAPIIVLGGGLASISFAGGLRSAGFQGGITVVADEPEPAYDRPPLSKDFLRDGDVEKIRLDLSHAPGVEWLRVAQRAQGQHGHGRTLQRWQNAGRCAGGEHQRAIVQAAAIGQVDFTRLGSHPLRRHAAQPFDARRMAQVEANFFNVAVTQKIF
jgi:hypothetical protein